jgi:hypothetical protein
VKVDKRDLEIPYWLFIPRLLSTSDLTFFFLTAVLGFEFRASHLLGFTLHLLSWSATADLAFCMDSSVRHQVYKADNTV